MKRLMILLLCLLLVLSSCTRQSTLTPANTLPPPSTPYDAPNDTQGMQTAYTFALYLPSENGQTLLCQYETAEISRMVHPAETAVTLLLDVAPQDGMKALSDDGVVALATGDSVQVSGDVCTVNLASGALQMSIQDLYTVCLSISTTLCALPDVSYVNILVAGHPLAMDVRNFLPLGVLTSAAGADLTLYWEQLVAQRTSVGGVAAQTPLSSAAVLYFPLTDGSGLTNEVRQLSFDGQDPQQLVYGLLDALSAGALQADNVPEMPDLRSLLLLAPEVTKLSTGRQSLSLHFVPDVLQQIAAMGLDSVTFFGAITLTMTAFVPNVEQVVIWAGDAAMGSLYSTQHGTRITPGGVMTRDMFNYLLTDPVTSWVCQEDALVRVTLNLPSDTAWRLDVLLSPVFQRLGVTGGIEEADIEGAEIQGDTILVNFASDVAQRIQTSGTNQRLLAYSLTGTLCQRYQVRRVRFFFGGESVDTLDGNVMWSGEFLPDPIVLP